MNKRGAGIVTIVIGAIAAIIGVIMGLVPVSAVGLTCGSVFAPQGYGADSLDSAFSGELCSGAIAGRAGWVWALIILGVIAVIVGTIIAVQRAPEPGPYRPDLAERLAERQRENPTV